MQLDKRKSTLSRTPRSIAYTVFLKLTRVLFSFILLVGLLTNLFINDRSFAGSNNLPENRAIQHDTTTCTQCSQTKLSEGKATGDVPTISTSSSELTELFRASFALYEGMRNNHGIYRDKSRFDSNNQDIPSSVAAIGIGLISLTIGDAMGWSTTSKQDAIVTLNSLLGNAEGFDPDRTPTGYFRHFIDMETGVQAWDSEYSTIDTALLMSGALFAESYFDDEELTALVQSLWDSIAWKDAIHDPQTGAIYREIQPDGTGVQDALTLPFNEYMLVAWFAYLDALSEQAAPSNPAIQLWEMHYADADSLPSSDYMNESLLTDVPGNYLSHFIVQFAYYLCNYFTVDTKYLEFFANARNADRKWWQSETTAEEFEWGLGAGTSIPPYFYHADKIGNNPGAIVSPHVVAGFLILDADSTTPPADAVRSDLLSLLNQQKGVYKLSLDGEIHDILWRYSLEQPGWQPDDVQAIDYASMLFGLAALPEHLGPDFFPTYNNSDVPFDGVLPVELVYFDGIVNGNTIELTWRTASELNNAGFEIQRLTNDSYKTIAFISGAGTTEVPVDYSFKLHDQSAGEHTFRLKQIDFDGQWTASTSVTLTVITHDIVLGAAHPNPFNPATVFSFELTRDMPVLLQVFDTNGKIVSTLVNEFTTAGSHEVIWQPEEHLASGTYVYRLQTSEGVYARLVAYIK